MNRNSINQPRFNDNVDSVEENDESINLSPIKRSHEDNGEQSFEQIESDS